MIYDHKSIEEKWIKRWDELGIYKTPKNPSKENKYYILPQLPYPSGSGLHVGHTEGYAACDIYARYQRLKGKDVLQVIGWDAFGLPAENYAIKTNIHPRINTDKAIDNFRDQIKKMGASVDWEREVGSHNPDYYKWTQWFFQLMYRRGLAYRKKQPVNWCESCKTVLANEQVEDNQCERCGTDVIQKELEQWFFKITKYADRLINDLDKVDWPVESVKRQRDWIGRSEGINITYPIKSTDLEITCFTTRPDTNYGATSVVTAPDSNFVKDNWESFPNKDEVNAYVIEANKKTELERIAEGKAKTGVFTGLYAINHLTKREMPIYVTDFVLGSVGTGNVVGVPGHDLRDFEFAKEKGLDIVRVVVSNDGDDSEITDAKQVQESTGKMINSDFLNGMEIMDAKEKIKDHIEENRWGKRIVNYKLRDWLVSRQRFWGAPIPMLYRDKDESEVTKDFNVLILHGTWGSGDGNWFEWLKDELSKDDIKTANPTLPDSKTPNYEERMKFIEENYKSYLTEKSVIVAHSSGTATALHLAEKYKLKKVILVSPVLSVDEEYKKSLAKGFDNETAEALEKLVNREIDFETINKNVEMIDVYIGKDDPYIPEDTEATAKRLFSDAQIHILEGRQHINEDTDGTTEFYEILQSMPNATREWKMVPKEDLPVILPDDVDFKPTGQSPLTYSETFHEGVEEKYGKGWKREVDTLDTFNCSSWYYYRYLDPKNDEEFASKEALDTWMPVDFYIGGPEHVTGHLLYSRFFTKVLHDAGYIQFDEPFKYHRHQGLILGEDNRKMSKRWGNVINPNDVVEEYGADTLRMYEMFMGPLEQTKSWSERTVQGVRKFINRVHRINNEFLDKPDVNEISRPIHAFIKNVEEGTENLKFNVVISEFMKLLNEMESNTENYNKKDWESYLIALSPYAPFVTEELWERLGHNESIHTQIWPEYIDELTIANTVTIGVQVNGKVRSDIEVSPDASQEEVRELVMSDEKLEKWLDGKEIKKFIYIPGRIVNLVI